MKDDEIKEKKTKRIIEKIEGLANYVTIPRELAIYNVNIDSQEAKLLTDYITNLQEENRRLKELIKDNTIQVQDENGNYQECNINVIKMYNDMQDDIENLIKEKEDYKSRNEKAIELINEMLECAYIDGKYIMYDYSTNEILEIKKTLTGGDEK